MSSNTPRIPEQYRRWWSENALVPYGYCWCGCGQSTNVAKCTDQSRSWVNGEPLRYLLGHNGRLRDETTARSLTPVQETEVCRRYEEGESGPTIAKDYDVHSLTIYNVLKRHGVEKRPSPARHRLTEAQELELAARYRNGESGPGLAEAYGISSSVIYAALRRHNVRSRSIVRYLTETQKAEVCERYRHGASIGTLAADLGAAAYSIRNILSTHDVKLRPNGEDQRKHECDHSFFDSIDSEEKAYWLGFIAADGGVVRNTLQVMLSARDREHLSKLKAALRSEHPIRPCDRDLVQLAVHSQPLVAGLARHGIHPRKTFTLQWPAFLSDELLCHYLRGLVDGDGGLYAYRSRTGGLDLRFQLTSSEASARGAQRYLVRAAGASMRRLRPHEKSSGIFNLQYSGNYQVARIYRLLYEGATIWLSRKRERVAHLLE